MSWKTDVSRRMKFCVFCGVELVWIDTGMDDVQMCPKSREDTIDMQKIMGVLHRS